MRANILAATLALTLAAIPLSTLADALWGAYAEGGLYWSGGEAIGYAWNYTTGSDAMVAAIERCHQEPPCAEHGIHKIRMFSSGADTGQGNFKVLSVESDVDVTIARFRCIAIEGLGRDFQVAFGNTETDAINAFGESRRHHVEHVVCNKR